MATSRDFSAMLNEYLPLDLLSEEYQKRDYVMQKAEKDDGWKGGALNVPFEGQHASSVEFGQLAADTDIAKDLFVRGQITTMPEVWGSMLFLHRDFMEHNGKINEKSFLKILPNRVDAFLSYVKMVSAVNMLCGPHFAKVTADTDLANGIVAVDRVDRFALSQKVSLDDDNSAPTTYYVIGINVNNQTVTLSATRGGAAANISAYTLAQNSKFYHPGAQSAGFTSLKSQLLTNANTGSSGAGSASLFGQTKTAYPYLQAVQLDGTGVTASNILDKVFDGYTTRMILGKGGTAPEIIMSFKHFGSILKLIEAQKGAFNVVANSRKVNMYGWQVIEIGSVSGNVLTLVGIQEMDDDVIMYIDWTAVKIFSNGMFQRRQAPDGKEYFELRATTGYSYVLDHCFFGDIAVIAPWRCAIMANIPNY